MEAHPWRAAHLLLLLRPGLGLHEASQQARRGLRARCKARRGLNGELLAGLHALEGQLLWAWLLEDHLHGLVQVKLCIERQLSTPAV